MIVDAECGTVETRPSHEVEPDDGMVRLDYNAPGFDRPVARTWFAPGAARRLASALLDAADKAQGVTPDASCSRCGAIK